MRISRPFTASLWACLLFANVAFGESARNLYSPVSQPD
jgi:hypothetical protein